MTLAGLAKALTGQYSVQCDERSNGTDASDNVNAGLPADEYCSTSIHTEGVGMNVKTGEVGDMLGAWASLTQQGDQGGR